MNKIAVFASAPALATRRIVSLFNEGNRVRVELIVTDDSATTLASELEGKNITVVHIPDSQWEDKIIEINTLLKESEIRLLAVDGFQLPIPELTVEAAGVKLIRLSSEEQAPREVVAALEEDLRKPIGEQAAEVTPENPSPEYEWAQALKIKFTPPKLENTPPPLPCLEAQEDNAGSEAEEPVTGHTTPPRIPKENTRINPDETYGGSRSYDTSMFSETHQYEFPKRHEEPMPSTYLIWSILSTVLCCFIPGIIAIIFSAQVSSRYYSGDLEGAKRASRLAEIWIIVSVVLGVLTATLYVPFMIFGS